MQKIHKLTKLESIFPGPICKYSQRQLQCGQRPTVSKDQAVGIGSTNVRSLTHVGSMKIPLILGFPCKLPQEK
jgi:hypothetical protein